MADDHSVMSFKCRKNQLTNGAADFRFRGQSGNARFRLKMTLMTQGGSRVAVFAVMHYWHEREVPKCPHFVPPLLGQGRRKL